MEICSICGKPIYNTDLIKKCDWCGKMYHRTCAEKERICGICGNTMISANAQKTKYDYLELYKQKKQSQGSGHNSYNGTKSTIFSNIADILKKIAIGTFIVGIISSVIAGICIMAASPDIDDIMFIVGIAVFFGGIVLSFCIAAFIYGFATLIENSEMQTKKLNDIEQKLNNIEK